MVLTVEQVEKILVGNKDATMWYFSLEKFFAAYEIYTLERISAFMAQCCHESGNFKVLSENLYYSAQGLRRVFPSYFPTDELAAQYAMKPEKIANRVYSSRMGNGPENSGDGWKYRGRGIIQLTGKNNYTNFANSIEKSIEDTIVYLETFDGALHSACWYWDRNNLNALADVKDMKTITKKINGGFNGLDDRLKKYETIQKILKEEN